MTSIWTALRDRHCAPEWAYFEEMRNGTGYSRAVTRTADALAFSLYPSRGLELHGFEVKTHRSDWLREKKDPEKAEEIARFCKCWWLATTEGVVKDVGEVPPGWGWLELVGKKLITRRTAPAREAKLLDLPMIAAILRRSADQNNAERATAIAEHVNERMKDERETRQEVEHKLVANVAETKAEARRYLALIHQLENALGEEIAESYGSPPVTSLPEKLIEKLRLFRATDLNEARRALEVSADQLRSAALKARWVLRQAGVRIAGRSARGFIR